MRTTITLQPHDVTRLPLSLPSGVWRVTLGAGAPVRIAAVTSAGPIRLRTEAGWSAPSVDPALEGAESSPAWIEGAVFVCDEPLDACHLWPVDEAVSEVVVAIEPADAWKTMCPDWALGPIRQPPRVQAVSTEPASTPASWSGRVRVDAVEAVTVDEDMFTVAECGIVRLAFDPPLAPGRVLLRAEFRDADRAGAPALVEPQLLPDGARSPRARIATMRRQWEATHAAVLTLTDATTHLLFRPRETEGRVRISGLSVHTGWSAGVSDPAPRRILAAIGDRLIPRGRSGPAPGFHPEGPERPAVTIVTATRDAPDHLSRYLESISRTAYCDVEVILVDNETTDDRALRLLEEARSAGITVLEDRRPFNFAALNNLAVRQARGEVLVFANNDIEFTDPGWLAPLVEAVRDPAVGVAGARLLYPDGRVQHAGLILAGEARVRHAERFLAGHVAGHHDRQRVVSRVGGVTGALMAVRRTTFEALGGFDAARYAVLFNDVDLCLKALRRGLSNVLVPAACAVHHESATIGQELKSGLFDRGGEIWQYERAVEGRRFRGQWAEMLDADPCYPSAYDPLDAGFRRRLRGRDRDM